MHKAILPLATRSSTLLILKLVVCYLLVLVIGFCVVVFFGETTVSRPIQVISEIVATDLVTWNRTQPLAIGSSESSGPLATVDSVSDERLLKPRLIYFPRIPKTGSETINALYNVWLSRYYKWKLRKFAMHFLVASTKYFTRTLNTSSLSVMLNSKARVVQTISEVNSRAETKHGSFAKTGFNHHFESNFADKKNAFTELSDGCAHTGGNAAIKRRVKGLKSDFKGLWNTIVEFVQTTENLFIEGLYDSMTDANSDEFASNVSMARKRAAVRFVVGTANVSLEIPFMIFMHFPFLKSVDAWIRQFIAPSEMWQLVTLRLPVSRLISLFYFSRLPDRVSQRTKDLLSVTHNATLLECVKELDTVWSAAQPKARSDPYDICHLTVNFQLKWLCGDLEHCPCADVLNYKHVEIAMQTTKQYFDFVGFVETMDDDFVKMRRKFFADVPESDWETVLPNPKKNENIHGKDKTAEDLEAADILAEVNAVEIEFYFYQRLFAAENAVDY